ncbi:hypothetical protein N9B49_01235 [bacterium]|nr:hypothetical protein [bacterium]
MHLPICSSFLTRFALTALLAGSALAQEFPFKVIPETVPPYYHVRYEGSDKPGELVYAVTYTIWMPPGVETLRGVILHQHGCKSPTAFTGLTGTFDLHWQALARKHGFALMSASYEEPKGESCGLWADPRKGSEAVFLKGLEDLGSKSNHPELATVPWALWGHSGGGAWTGGMTSLHPERVIALWLQSGPITVEPNPDRPNDNPYPLTPALLEVPIMSNQGTREGITDTDSRFATVWQRYRFLINSIRSKGGLIGHSVDAISEHNCGNQRYLAMPWFDACISARLPRGGDGSLLPMSKEDGWVAPLLGTRAVPAHEYNGDIGNSGWLPNQRIAEAWMSYTQDTYIPDETPPPAPENLIVKDRELSWTAEADLESGLSYFVIERDGEFLAKVPENDEHTIGRPLFQPLYNSDAPRQPLPSMSYTDTTASPGTDHDYRVFTVNTVGLRSGPDR